MPQEFKVKNGLIVDQGGATITGSLSVSGNITTSGLPTGSVLFISGSNGVITGSSNLFWDNTNGRLGVGTATPTYKVQIEDANTPAIRLIDTTNAAYVDLSVGNFDASLVSNGRIFVQSSTTLSVTSTNVGIGVTNPISAKLQVRGSGVTSGTTSLRVDNANTSASLIVLDNGFVGINTGSAQYNLDVNGTARVLSSFRCDGQVTFTSSVIGTTIRLGSNPQAASSVLDVQSTTKGFLPPRTATTASIASPAQGLITYITGSANEGLHYYNSGSQTGWHKVLTNTGSQSITGSLIATSFTGSLQGTSSWATNALTASYVNPLIQNVIITGSLITSGTYGGINTVSNKPNLFDINGITRVQWSDGVLNSSANDTTVDWENKVLYDSTTNTALDWENRGLYDTAGSPSIDWTGRILSETTNTFKALDYSNDSYLDSQLYYRNIIPGQVQQALSDSPLYAGQVIQATVDAGVTDYDLVSLDTDGTWKSVKAAVGYGADKMLGICVDQANGYVLIEGDVGVGEDDSQGAYVVGAAHGLPVYASTTTSEMTTTAPSGAGAVVRVVGHIYYQSTSNTSWWTMKFRPSNDWYVI
jgi:hypothetical protein